MIRFSRIVGGAIVMAYAALAFGDYHCGTNPRAQIPPSVRAAPGGIGSWSFWHSGEHGGK